MYDFVLCLSCCCLKNRLVHLIYKLIYTDIQDIQASPVVVQWNRLFRPVFDRKTYSSLLNTWLVLVLQTFF